MADRQQRNILFKPVKEQEAQSNFNRIEEDLASLGPLARARVSKTYSLVVGDNELVPTISSPKGRITVFQSAAADIYDVGLRNGRWVVNSSAVCDVRFIYV